MASVAADERRTLTHYYLATPAAVGIARKAAMRTALVWGYPVEKAEDVCLVVSELITNAVVARRHSEIQMTLAENGAGGILIKIRDQSRELPRTKVVSPLAEDGRGLWIVETLAIHCGVNWEHGRKVVFAVL